MFAIWSLQRQKGNLISQLCLFTEKFSSAKTSSTKAFVGLSNFTFCPIDKKLNVINQTPMNPQLS